MPAPYIPNTEMLVTAADTSENIVFYRGGVGAIADRSSYDIFATQFSKVQGMTWKPSGTHSWPQQLAQFDKLNSAEGALAGYISYEAGFAFEERWQNRLHLPVSGFAWRFAQVPCWYVADHTKRLGQIVAVENAEAACMERLMELVEYCSSARAVLLATVPQQFDKDAVGELGEMSQAAYESAVSKIQEDITSGRYYELNFTQRFHIKSKSPPATLFASLFRRLLPRRGFYCSFEDECILSLSPELYLAKFGEIIATRPVKGSMLAGVSCAEWEKLRAEHVMVVDLARNDIGRASNLRSVSVDEFAAVKEFGGLRHLESSISGESSFDWKNVVSLTYPAASITGAPKVEVVQAIQEYEQSPRNVYTGTCGWVWPNGNVDLNVAIRTATAVKETGEWKYELGAGGAIVADSDPAAEYLECLRKVFPLVNEISMMNNCRA